MRTLEFLGGLTFCLFLGSLAQMNDIKSYVRQESGFKSLNAGDNVTLRCFLEGNALMFYWYKQTLGQKPRIVSTFYKRQAATAIHVDFKNDSRFTLDAGNDRFHMTISNVNTSDTAVYYCMGCYAYDFVFTEGTTISVTGPGSNVPALVHESESGATQLEDSVPLNCTVHPGTCDGDHSVYWFKDSGESLPGIIYTHGDRNDKCEKKTETQTHTCVYNLPETGQDSSHAGTSYCAVASCGHLLFKNMKKLESGSGHALVLYVLSGALAFTTILAVLLTYAAFTLYRSNNQHTPESQVSSSSSTPNADSYQDSDNIHYAALRKHKIHKAPKQRDDTYNDCVYSSIRQ